MKTLRIFIFGICLFIGFTSLCSFVFAADTSERSSYQLQEVVVIESKYPQTPQELTHMVDIVTSEDIPSINLSNRNLAEIIRYLPGNFVNPLSRNDANWGSYGGLGPKYNTWLLDGLPIDSFVDPMSLDSTYLERIEVHRGPGSVLYPNYMTMDFAGNETPLAGITNLITKDKIEKPRTNISFGYGSWNTINGRVYHEGNAGPFNFFLGTNFEQSDYTNYGTTPSWLNMIDDPDYKKLKAYAKATYFLNNDSKVSLFIHHTKHDGDTGRPYRGYDHEYDVINFHFTSPIASNLRLQLKGGYRYYDRSWEEDNYPTNLTLRERQGVTQNIYPFDMAINFKHWNNSLLTFGSDAQFSTYETYANVTGVKNMGNDVDAENYGVYLQEKINYQNWVFRLGARYNYTKHEYDLIGGVKPYVSDKSWDKVLYSVGVRYNVTDRLGIYANSGSSFLVPSAKSVGGTLTPGDLGVPGKNGQLPNPSIRPEKGLSHDLGLDFWVGNALNLNLRGFYHLAKDTIVTNVVSTTPSQSMDINAGKSKTYGTEFEVNYFQENKYKYFANVTLTSTEIKNNLDPNQDGADIPFVPRYIVNAGITAKFPYDFTFSPYIQYVAKYYDSSDKTNRREFGGYATVNLNIQKPLFKTEKYQATTTLELNNIFDREYVMPWQFQDPGFNCMLRFNLNF